ncbi:MAG: hypothetical protein K6T55_06700 [Syntrophobacterales bacterium]|nr:hypothetical protein [Syntrophobacterales bacterium]
MRAVVMRMWLASLLVAAAWTGEVRAWGDAPTHFSLCGEPAVQEKFVLRFDPGLFPLFVEAAAGPDLANTLLFQASGRDYIHGAAFLAALDYVASRPKDRRWRSAWRPTWPVIAAAWRAHLAADEVAHSQYVPPDSPRHELVELAVDTCVYYLKPVPEALGDSWREVNISEAACDPALLYWASYLYTGGRLPVYPWMTREALGSLRRSIEAAYELHEARGGPEGSEALLKFLVPGKDWKTFYGASVTAVVNSLP